MISVSLIGHIIQKVGWKNTIDDWKEKKESFSELIDKYIYDEIDSLTYREVGFPILYLLCRDRKFEYKNRISDFKNITFGEENQIKETVEQLLKIGLIRQSVDQKGSYKGNDVNDKNLRNYEAIEYEMAHDYLIEKVLPICIKEIPTDIRGNIENYNQNYQIKRNTTNDNIYTYNYDNVCNNKMKKVTKRL